MSKSSEAGFAGMTVVSFESRMAEVMSRQFEKQNGRFLSAPSMQEVPLGDNPEVAAFGKRLLAGEVDVLMLMTGVGTRLLFKLLDDQFGPEAIGAAFSKLTSIARGPKVVQAMRERRLTPTMTVPEPNTWRDLIEILDESKESLSLENSRIVLQEYGESNEALVRALKQRGAQVTPVPVYRWTLPEDRKPLKQAVEAITGGKVHFAFFTSANQIRNVMKFAAEIGQENQLRSALRKVVIASVGPTCTEALQAEGLVIDFEPSHPKMGQLVSECAEQASRLWDEKQNGPSLVIRPRMEREVAADEVSRRREAPFLKACRREPAEVTPLWLMRQAGRYLKEYRQIRNRVSFIELCKNKELCAEVAVVCCERLKADAAILFSDILLIVEPLGMELAYLKNDGPVITGQLKTLEDVNRLPEVNPEESLHYVFDAVELTRQCLNPMTPLIGFSGAPFTLAAYMIEGGSSKTFLQTKRWMYSNPEAWHALMAKISRGITLYLQGQVKAGADALQLFDSWVGCLGPADYRQFVQPHTRSIIEALPRDIPVIHFGTGTTPFLTDIRDAGGDVIGVDFHTEIGSAWDQLGQDVAVQGNLDPTVLFADQKTVLDKAKHILDQVGDRPGHIFNLGHGILPATPTDNVLALIDFVHQYSSKQRQKR